MNIVIRGCIFMNSDYLKDNQVKEAKPEGKNGYTYGDYLTWDDGKRYELIDGVVYCMTPAPTRRHQQLVGEIFRQISNYLLDKECEVYIAPFDVRLPLAEEEDKNITTVVQPDLVVVCDQNKLDERGCKGAPELVIEVVSPSSANRDRNEKKELYEKHGVKEYWLVDYSEKTVEVYLLNEDGQYGKSVVYTGQEKVPVSIFNDLEIDLGRLFI
jgi:Uma2 family endonuclease